MGVGQEKNKIIVVGIPTSSTTEDLRNLCRPFGTLQEATIVTDADGAGRGFGFVRFESEEAQLAAVAKLDRTQLKGRTLNVRVVEKRGHAAGSAPAGSGKGRPCFDFARGKCTKGASCKWAHVAAADSAPDGAVHRSRRPEWQQKRDLDSSVPAALQGIPEDVCRKYQLGKCHRGAACRWKHVLYKGPRAGAVAGVAADEPRVSKPAMPAPRAAAGPEALAPKKRKAVAAAAEVGADASTADEAAGPSAAPAAAAAPPAAPPSKQRKTIGGEEDAGAEVARLERQLQRKEEAWRAQHADAADGPVPAEAKNRDVVWRALERKLQQARAAA